MCLITLKIGGDNLIKVFINLRAIKKLKICKQNPVLVATIHYLKQVIVFPNISLQSWSACEVTRPIAMRAVSIRKEIISL